MSAVAAQLQRILLVSDADHGMSFYKYKPNTHFINIQSIALLDLRDAVDGCQFKRWHQSS